MPRIQLQPLDVDSATLHGISSDMYPWLRAVVVLSFLSFISAITLLILLAYRLIQWHRKAKRTNQFVILIFNLLIADVQQSMAFLLNIEWLRVGSVVVGTPICYTQGWLISTGDLASGVWCFVIGLHTFASVVLDFRVSNKCFCTTIIALWTFIYGISLVGVGMYGKGLYVRSGIWCWIHHDLQDLRLWLHYFWIFVFEFGNVIIYALIYLILLTRIRTNYYTPAAAARVHEISLLMLVYPLVYVICTIPLASARMAAMGGHPPSYTRLCLAACMITSNGWLDVLLYTLTRRIMVFSDEPPPDDNGIDTFAVFWAEKSTRFGGTWSIEGPTSRDNSSKHGRPRRGFGSLSLPLGNGNESESDLVGAGNRDIKLVTTTRVFSEPAQPDDLEEIEEMTRKRRPRTPVGRWSEESGAVVKELDSSHIPSTKSIRTLRSMASLGSKAESS
ncbi:integral membrane protein-like protein [Bimuria novae-zelandiae CBS 107.79]|uniref:Integral membrane protein-like protein n=1 Tax=Bimuria novae-zelandiae CBS 107.79 TaxID=1447943 RepID=A0A6A5UJJ1_9PLEO|nr:integral membrane protein-like protein [Bimuria novae-zelandiae CBS 107.79]